MNRLKRAALALLLTLAVVSAVDTYRPMNTVDTTPATAGVNRLGASEPSIAGSKGAETFGRESS